MILLGRVCAFSRGIYSPLSSSSLFSAKSGESRPIESPTERVIYLPLEKHFMTPERPDKIVAERWISSDNRRSANRRETSGRAQLARTRLSRAISRREWLYLCQRPAVSGIKGRNIVASAAANLASRGECQWRDFATTVAGIRGGLMLKLIAGPRSVSPRLARYFR